MMSRYWAHAVAVAAGLLLVANVALAQKEDNEMRAKETTVTLSIKDVSADEAVEMICNMGGFMVTKKDMPEKLRKVTIELKDIPMLDGLKKVTEMAGLTFAVTDDGIEIAGKPKKK